MLCVAIQHLHHKYMSNVNQQIITAQLSIVNITRYDKGALTIDTSLALIITYCRYKFIAANLVTVQTIHPHNSLDHKSKNFSKPSSHFKILEV